VSGSIRPVHSFNYKETHHVIPLLYTILKHLIGPGNRFRATLAKIGFVVVMTTTVLIYAPPVGLALVGLSLLFAQADRKKKGRATSRSQPL
jgi:hypothetical protein